MHTCLNPECRTAYAIDDESLWELVRNQISAAEETEIQPSEQIMKAIRRLNNEIEHDLQSLNMDGESLKNKIFEYAALQYAALRIKRESMDFTKLEPYSPAFIRELKRRVSAVLLDNKDKIRLQMTDGQVIGKEESHYAASNN